MKSIKRIAIITPSARQAPFLEFTSGGLWRVWQSYRIDPEGRLFGTYMELHASGLVLRHTTNSALDITTTVVVSGEAPERSENHG